MKRLMIIIGFCSIFSISQAQTWNEWFRQKKTQKKYLVQQIAVLKIYLKYLKEGYDVAKKGLGMIGDIKDGNLQDHSNYFGSLSIVNPSVKSSNKIGLVVAYQEQIISEFSKLRSDCRRDQNLTTEEIQYVDRVYANLLSDCESSITELNVIVTDNSSQLKDDERIERIDQIYSEMNDRRAFARSFSNSTRMLMSQRSREASELERSRRLNEVL